MPDSTSPGKPETESLLGPGGVRGFIRRMLPAPEQVKAEWPVYIFLVLSWFSTTAGLVGLIKGEREGWFIGTWLIIGFLIFGATLMMKRFLDAIFLEDTWRMKVVAFLGYLFLMGVSIFFGFAFYWSQIEARQQTFGDAIEAIEANSDELNRRKTQLEEVNAAYQSLAAISEQKYDEELNVGFTCERTRFGGPGDGPRREFRRQECTRFKGFADQIDARITLIDTGERRPVDPSVTQCGQDVPALPPAPEPVNPNLDLAEPSAEFTDPADIPLEALPTTASLQALNQALLRIRDMEARTGASREDRELRQREFDRVNGMLRQFRNRFSTLVEGPLVRGRIPDLRIDAAQYEDENFSRRGPNSSGNVSQFRCHDPDFARRLDDTADTLERMTATPIRLQDLVAKDGAKATREAFRRLWGTMTGFTSTSRSDVSPERRETELRAEIRLALNEESNGADNDERLRELESQLQEVLSTKAESRVMRANDYPPLFIASIVDLMILFATVMAPRKRRWLFSRASERQRRFIHDQVMSPLKRAELIAEAGETVPRYRLHDEYSVILNGERFLVLPQELPRADEYTTLKEYEARLADDKAMRIMVEANALEGVTKRRRLVFGADSASIRDQLRAKGSQLAERRGGFEIWAVPKSYWHELTDDAMHQVKAKTGRDISEEAGIDEDDETSETSRAPQRALPPPRDNS
ncbi:MAG: hypothetical protein MRY64_02730 [Hyphomonadaceae bacterium]|nr:hypothetical protein [Hyphomonadaceae bacterium]